ncbi:MULTISPECIES: structural cement protein Gp24 [unclassified Sphingomonas]|uniref:structural cement protein Gp24 n=1 Tax=unclassified Sphingomonas TaxID=196159 RepID=UPI000700836D|nr:MULTISPECIES: hypothetical protein [unclassified Sphingomonas]KQX18408.1 hypothetical protein ASD17_14700 [Sphingomonas sp. Root1294]KQY72267.1 hypothetical protein ASD39_20275 [Sphingomonas sp. Root50]KRB94462.1 hypothetical protein ASE22_00475 [Sphingomonas sp. Root720]
MAVLQNSFSEDIPYGYAGMEADGELSNIITRTLEGDTACAFGRPVYRGTADKGVTLTVSAALMGFAIARKGLPVTSGRAADTFAPGDNVPIKERGKIWVTSAATTTDGAQVYVTSAGAVTSSSGGNTAATGWFFEDTLASAPGLVRIVRR